MCESVDGFDRAIGLMGVMNGSFLHPTTMVALTLLCGLGCVAKAGDVGGLDETGASDTEHETSTSTMGGSEDPSGETESPSDPPPWCDDVGDESDLDGDGIVDAIDLCPTVPEASNTADSDRDGVGNACDTCRRTLEAYNDGADAALIPAYMRVRNIPDQTDSDEDGIGDACDNCVWEPNCESFGPSQPWEVGDAIDVENDSTCQVDADGDFIGDACAGAAQRPNAAGPIGFDDDDDFDQDGITNALDACPRQPLADAIACEVPGDCPGARSCDDGWCNHADRDGDGVGDICDTCPASDNPIQVFEGGMQEDDEDGDFVGSACETTLACNVYADPRPFGFHDVAVDGQCCTVQLVEAVADANGVATGDLLDASSCASGAPPTGDTCTPVRAPNPDDPQATLPLRTAANCPGEQVGGVWVCRQLRPGQAATPGILVPPPGCADALATAGTTALENTLAPLTPDDFASEPNPLDALWQHQCFRPQRDPDFDGLGDPCDLCPSVYDPDNTPYVAADGTLHQDAGQYCNGPFAC